MNYLLDTHVFLWSILDKAKLSKLVQQTIEDANNLIFVSAVSIWEISLKSSLGKMELSGLSPGELPDLALKTGFQLINLTSVEAAGYHKLKLNNHKDPFDRMLIWQAIHQNLTFISKDRSVAQYSADGLNVMW